MSNAKRVALVTGGTRGIGLGIASSLAREGLNLVVNGRRELEDDDEVFARLRGLGAEVLYARGDIASPADRERLIAAVRKRFGRLDVLVNNAGVTSRDRGLDLLEAKEENFEWLMRVNLQGPFFLTQLAARWMIEEAESDPDFAGCVVFISSVSAEMVSDTRADYCLSKAALSLATKVWASRLAAHRIGVYEIRPGLVRTDLNAAAWEKYDRFIAEGNLLEARWGTPDDIGRTVAMLARGDLPYATGQTLTLDGGLSMPRL